MNCTKYYAGQYSYSAPGVGGWIKAQDVSLIDPTDDVVASWVGALDTTGTSTWLQAGFWEGEIPYSNGGSLSSPHLYTEIRRGDACFPAYGWVDRGLPGGTFDSVYAQYVPNQWEGYCGGVYVYTWWLRRGSPTSPPMDVNFMRDPFGRIDANTEIHNHSSIEPLNNQCFGTTTNCLASCSCYGVKYFNYSSWQLWTTVPSYIYAHPPYQRWGLINYYSFYATRP
ncbi:MAG: hypothetical protein WED85_13640 [Dehalococcoidia bacterium]